MLHVVMTSGTSKDRRHVCSLARSPCFHNHHDSGTARASRIEPFKSHRMEASYSCSTIVNIRKSSIGITGYTPNNPSRPNAPHIIP